MASTPARAPFRGYGRLCVALAGRRRAEVMALQASPIIGAVLGGVLHRQDAPARLSLLLISSLMLTAYVFIFNDWANYYEDLEDAERTGRLSGEGPQERRAILLSSMALLTIALVVLTAAGLRTVLFGGAVALLGVAYSSRSILGKGAPGGASLNHLVGGSLHFLLGYAVVKPVDLRGVAISLFFGLVFAAGHLNQEIRDREADALTKTRTVAVLLGARPTFFASLLLFSAAYLVLLGLALLGLLPHIMALSVIAWAAQMIWSQRALNDGLDRRAAVWLQRRYRLLFGIVGVALLVTAV